MKTKTPKPVEPEKLPELKQEEKPLLTEGQQEDLKQEVKKEKMTLRIPGFQHLPLLSKLRVIIGTIFMLCTLAVLLIFVIDFIYPAILLLLCYLLLFILTVKLFMIKRL